MYSAGAKIGASRGRKPTNGNFSHLIENRLFIEQATETPLCKHIDDAEVRCRGIQRVLG